VRFRAPPSGYEGWSATSSGLAFKNRYRSLIHQELLSADYRGNWCDFGIKSSFEIQGERLRNSLCKKHDRAEWVEVQELSQTARGEGGLVVRRCRVKVDGE
jgi:dUTP pyrophosphatase